MGKLHYFTVLVLIILLAIASGRIFESMDNNTVLTQADTRHVADYFLQNFTATEMNKMGLPAYQVKAAYLEHYSDNDSMELRFPVFSFYENNIKTWTAQANEALIFKKSKTIFLNGAVLLKQNAKIYKNPLVLTAKQLTIKPEQHTASTKTAIMLVQDQNQINAIGMYADLDKSRFEFLSKTRSHYVLPAE